MRLKPGDLAPSLKIDTNADVTGATSTVAKIRRFHQATVMTKTMTVVDAPTGVLNYDWVSGDTDTAGTYEVKAVVTFSGGKVETFPQGSHLELLILP